MAPFKAIVGTGMDWDVCNDLKSGSRKTDLAKAFIHNTKRARKDRKRHLHVLDQAALTSWMSPEWCSPTSDSTFKHCSKYLKFWCLSCTQLYILNCVHSHKCDLVSLQHQNGWPLRGPQANKWLIAWLSVVWHGVSTSYIRSKRPIRSDWSLNSAAGAWLLSYYAFT